MEYPKGIIAYFGDRHDVVPAPFIDALEKAFGDTDMSFTVFYAYGFGVNTCKPRYMGCLIVQDQSDGRMYKITSSDLNDLKVVEMVPQEVKTP
jgi:hypothetical protein